MDYTEMDSEDGRSQSDLSSLQFDSQSEDELKLPPIETFEEGLRLTYELSSRQNKPRKEKQSDKSGTIRRRLHEAVVVGDMDAVEELLDEPGADINSSYYGENLLWTAIMNNQEEMATFLIDNGIDTEFKCCRVEIPAVEEKAAEKEKEIEKEKEENDEDSTEKKSVGKIKVKVAQKKVQDKKQCDNKNIADEEVADVFVVDCRQLAYEKEMSSIVNLIDFKLGCLPKWLKPPDHIPRLIKSANQRRLEADLIRDMALPADRTPTPGRKRRCGVNNRRITSSPLSQISAPSIHSCQPSTDMNSNSLAVPPITVPVPPSASPMSSHRSHSSLHSLNSQQNHNPSQHQSGPSQPLFTRTRPLRCDSAYTGPPSHPPNARIRLTKTAVVRRSFVAASMEDMKIRHNEITDLEISSSQRTKSSMSGFIADLRVSKPFQHRFSLPTQSSQAKVSHHTLSFPSCNTKRKPIYAHHLVRTTRKSPHSYQHSALIGHKQKFIGRS